MKSPAFLFRLFAATLALFSPQAVHADRAPAITFLRSTETEEKLSAIQTSSVEYQPAKGRGPSVWLVSVSHLGTPEYYAAIQKRLDAQSVVLFEGVGLDDQMRAGPGAATHEAGIQKQLSDALGLVFQLDAIDYRRKNFLNSDLPVAGVEKEVKERTDTGEAPNETYKMLIGAIQGTPETMDMLKPMMAFLTASPDMRETTRLLLIEVLSRADEMVGFAKSISPEMKDLFDVLLTERNAIVMRDLRAQIARHKAGETIAVFYGAAHMTDIAKRLREELHYKPATQQWDTAFTADPSKSALPPAQLKMMLDMVRAQMKQGLPKPDKKGAESPRKSTAGAEEN